MSTNINIDKRYYNFRNFQCRFTYSICVLSTPTISINAICRKRKRGRKICFIKYRETHIILTIYRKLVCTRHRIKNVSDKYYSMDDVQYKISIVILHSGIAIAAAADNIFIIMLNGGLFYSYDGYTLYFIPLPTNTCNAIIFFSDSPRIIIKITRILSIKNSNTHKNKRNSTIAFRICNKYVK